METRIEKLSRLLEELDEAGEPTHRIELCRDALKLARRRTEPEAWAALHHELARNLLQQSDAEEDAIRHFKLALTIRTRRKMPAEWARTTLALANAYVARRRGRRVQNLERAITLYQQARSVRDTTPDERTRAAHNLGNVYVERLRGEPEQNLRVAIRCYQRALRGYAAEEFGDERAIVLSNLATAYSLLPDDDSSKNLERSITTSQAALQALTRERHPDEWARVQANLGAAYAERRRGRPDDNLEHSIACYEEALQVATAVEMPDTWAATLEGLLMGYPDRRQGDRAANLERAIECGETLCAHLSVESTPVALADVLNNLAYTYISRLNGERSTNIERAVELFEQSLALKHARRDQEDYGQILHNLANAYLERTVGDLAENVERAIHLFEQALKLRTRRRSPLRWARSMSDLANAYGQRVKGDRVENTERAIRCYKAARAVFNPATAPLDWASITRNLGVAYLERVRGDYSLNLESAVSELSAALEFYAAAEEPEDGALAASNLASALVDRVEGDHAEHVERALELIEGALQILSRQDAPRDWAYAMNVRGRAYFDRPTGDAEENLAWAIDAFEQALAVVTELGQPVDTGVGHNILGLAWGRRMHGDRKENVTCAIAHFYAALRVRTVEAFPVDHAHTQRFLGNLFFSEGRWADAHEAYAAALHARELLYLAGATPESRFAEWFGTTEAMVNAAWSLAKLGRIVEAIGTLERGLARGLSEALILASAKPETLTPTDYEEFVQARARIHELEAEARAEGRPGRRDFLAISADLRGARAGLDRLLQRVRGYAPDFLSAGLDGEGVRQVATLVGKPLIYLLTTARGSLALIVPPADADLAEQAIWLEEFKSDDLDELLHRRGPDRGYLYGVVIDRPKAATLLATILNDVMPVLDVQLMTPILEKLEACSYREAALIAVGSLALLPLPNLHPGRINFSLAPSAQSLAATHNLARQKSKADLLIAGVGSPISLGRTRLTFAELELNQVIRSFPTTAARTLVGDEATSTALARILPGATHLHFCGHGFFDVLEPLDSGLNLAGMDILTMRDLLDGKYDLADLQLVVLSACQTGFRDTLHTPDEYVSLATAFLQAGVPGIVSTLWPIDDVSAAVFFGRFYHLLLHEGRRADQALHQAQHWLREATAQEISLAAYWERQGQLPGSNQQKARLAAEYYRANPDVKPFSSPRHWAGYVFCGCGR